MIEEGNIDNCKKCKKTSRCFQYLYPDDLEFINKKKTQLIYLKGENLFKQGAFAPYIMYVVDGLVKTYLQTGYEKQINIRLVKSGEFLAFSTIFDGNVYNYSAMAIKETTICMIDKTALKHLLTKNSDFAIRIISKNCKSEGALLKIIKNVSYKQMRGKIATALLYLSADEFLDEEIFQYLTRQDIADFASISNESTIKFIKEFEKEGILKLDRKDIKIINKDKLEDIGNKG